VSSPAHLLSAGEDTVWLAIVPVFGATSPD
jgi:hypothetical protein